MAQTESVRTSNAELIFMNSLLARGKDHTTFVPPRIVHDADLVYGQSILRIYLVILSVRVIWLDAEVWVAFAFENDEMLVLCSVGVGGPVYAMRGAGRGEVVAADRQPARR